MAGPVESYLGFFDPEDPLFSLEADLDDILSEIAFGDMSLEDIEEAKAKLKKKHHRFATVGLRGDDADSESPLLVLMYCLGMAYDSLFFYEWEGNTLEERAEMAKDVLGECHFLGNGMFIPITVRMNSLNRKGCYDKEGNHKGMKARMYELRGARIYSDGSYDNVTLERLF